MVNVDNIFAWFLIPGIFFILMDIFSLDTIYIEHEYRIIIFIKVFDIWTVSINILYFSSAKKGIKYVCNKF